MAQAFSFVFPTALFWLTLASCVVLAALASYCPTRPLAKLPISAVLKGRTTR
jgi:hypothetical protein